MAPALHIALQNGTPVLHLPLRQVASHVGQERIPSRQIFAALVSQQPANKDCYTQVVKPAGSQLSYKLAYTSANETYGFKGEKEWYEWLKAWKKQIEEPVQVSVSVIIR